MTDPARRGRPRNEAVDQVINQTVLELIAEQGIGGLSIEGIAAKAGVGKTTLYRRWSGKDELVQHALATLNDDLPVAEGETTRERLTSLLDGMLAQTGQALSMRLFPRVMSHRRTDPHTYSCFYQRVIEPRRERFLQELRRAQQRGELRPEVNMEHAVNLLVGPMLYQLTVLPDATPDLHLSASQLVEAVFSGIAATEV